MKSTPNKHSKKSPPRKQANKKRGNKFRRILKFRYLFFIVFIALLIVTVLFIKELPSPTKLQSNDFPVSTQIFDRNQELLYEIYADTNRTPVAFDTMPEHLIQSTLAIEDASFYHHFGFSVQGIIRAAKNTLFNDKLQGGSTITQQLVKTALLTPERTIQRKIKEAFLTIGTEVIYSKDQILEMYLNHIPYGGTAYGIEAASQRYFDKPAAELSLAEASFLAGLPQAPSRYSPFTNPDQAKDRHREVLRRMVEEEYISQEEADLAFSEKLLFAPPSTDIKAPHFVFYVKNLLEEKYGLQTIERGGFRVTTTLDSNLQEYVQSTVSAEIEELDQYRVTNGAALVTNPSTGEVLAMVGSRDYFDTENDGQVNVTNRLRQPGSSIKPINYATALQLKTLKPDSLIIDMPTCFVVTGQKPYCPQNYDGGFHGPVEFGPALANSYNIPAVKVLAINSLENFIATASAMGINSFTDPSRYGLSLTLGGGEVTMLDMATAFGTLANQGVKVPLNPILKITDHQGNLIEENQPESTFESLQAFYDESNPDANKVHTEHNGLQRILNREPAYVISEILSNNQTRSAAFGSRSALYIPEKPVSVKTGTTNDLRDNWTIGYTPDRLVATWVGNNDNTPMNPYVVSGVTGAAPIWNSIMTYLVSEVDADQIAQKEPIGAVDDFIAFWEPESFPEDHVKTRKNIWINKDTNKPAFLPGQEEPPNLEELNLELQEHEVVSDHFSKEFCLDCDWTNPETGEKDMPRINVDMTKFYLSQLEEQVRLQEENL